MRGRGVAERGVGGGLSLIRRGLRRVGAMLRGRCISQRGVGRGLGRIGMVECRIGGRLGGRPDRRHRVELADIGGVGIGSAGGDIDQPTFAARGSERYRIGRIRHRSRAEGDAVLRRCLRAGSHGHRIDRAGRRGVAYGNAFAIVPLRLRAHADRDIGRIVAVSVGIVADRDIHAGVTIGLGRVNITQTGRRTAADRDICRPHAECLAEIADGGVGIAVGGSGKGPDCRVAFASAGDGDAAADRDIVLAARHADDAPARDLGGAIGLCSGGAVADGLRRCCRWA